MVMNQSCLLGDLWLCHGLWDGAMADAGGSRRGAESQAMLWGPLSFLCFTLPGPPPSYPPSCCVYTLYIFNSHIPPSNVFILLPLYVRTLRQSLSPPCLQEARSTILLHVPSQRENGDAWQVVPKTPTEKKQYLENVLRIGANAKAQESQDRYVTSKCTANHSSDSLTIRYTSMETASPHLFIFCV